MTFHTVKQNKTILFKATILPTAGHRFQQAKSSNQTCSYHQDQVKKTIMQFEIKFYK